MQLFCASYGIIIKDRLLRCFVKAVVKSVRKDDTMKKTLTIITLFCLIFTLCAPSYAARTDEAHAAVLESIKQRIPDTNSFDEFDSSSYKTGEKTAYNFSWYNSENEESFKSMQVNVTDSGFITSFHYNDSSKEVYSSKPSLKKLDTNTAMEKTISLIEKLNPVLIGKFTLSPRGTSDLNSKNHRFTLQRTENGIAVYGDTGYVTISENADVILSFNMQYTEGLSFPDCEKIISKEEAQKAFAEKIGMTLLYEMNYTENNPAPFVAYRIDAGREYIDALTGDVITPTEPKVEIFMDKNESASADSALGAAKPSFSQAELDELEKISGLMDEDDASSVVKNNKTLSVSKDAALAYASLYADGKDNYFYNLRFETENGERINATLNAKNGEIKSFNRSYSDYRDYKDKTVDEALAKACVEALASDYYKADDSGEYRFENANNQSFTFVRYINDIPFFNDTITITIAPDTGAVLSYYFSRTEAEFPYPESLLTENEACEKLFEQVDYNLFYYPACSEEEKEYCDIAHLVYIPDENKNALIYADSGKLVYDESESEVTGKYTDISGHWAEDIIKELAAYAIGFSDDKFRPDDVIVQKDFVELLTSVVARNYPVVIGKNHSYDSAYFYAGNRNIIKDGEKAPEEAVTREKAAVYMIRAIELEEVASLKGIYRSLYDDVTDNTGYISILSGMKILSGYNGLFNPQREMTRAEAMVMIYNYLSN